VQIFVWCGKIDVVDAAFREKMVEINRFTDRPTFTHSQIVS
jgi:hypothetical protein